jgi:hypothetical protein
MNSHERRRFRRSGVVDESTPKLRKPPRAKPHKGPFVKYVTAGRVLWAIVGVGATLLGYSVLKPSVSIEPYSSQDTRNPFSEQFYVQNNSIYDISKVHPGCDIQEVRGGKRGYQWFAIDMASESVDELASGAKTTTTCPLEKALDNSPLSYDELRIGIWAAYKLPFGMSRCTETNFIGKPAAGGTFIWTFAGSFRCGYEAQK